MADWTVLSELMRITTSWVTLVGERWRCERGNERDYWRVEKPDSVIVLPLHADSILCIQPTFRPGIQRSTLDFPGGRLPEGHPPHELIPALLERELGIPPTAILSTLSLNSTPWAINSSFSNQGLWGFAVTLDETFEIPQALIGARVKANDCGISELLTQLDCLQCRAVLLEWQHQQRAVP